ncbi:hypothetical protein CNR22_01990 [Sphingobacteriaceae bacterium]|nr:hypothetical protein CNR22_01990 [Sphingobacteriaceae bacterium]
MEKQHTFKLIDGDFTPSEARNILFALITSKISFHSTESFGITVRTSGDTSFHEKRIKQLTQNNKEVKNLMDYAEENKFRLRINGTVEIKLMNEEG